MYCWDKKHILELCKNQEDYIMASEILDAYDNQEIWDVWDENVFNVFFADQEYLKDFDFIYENFFNLAQTPLLNNEHKTMKNNFTYEERLELVHDFYQSIDSQIFTIFEKQFAMRHDHLRFLEKNENSTTVGLSYPLKNSQESYISVTDNPTLMGVSTLVHEYAHSVCAFIGDIDLNEFIEIESMFMELICQDYFTKINTFKNDALVCQTTLINDNVMYIREIVKKFLLVYSEFNISALENEQDFIKSLSKTSGINKNEVKKLLAFRASDNMPYPLSFIFAITLYNIYQDDKEKAFYLFKELLKIKTTSPYQFYESLKKLGINPASSLTLKKKN